MREACKTIRMPETKQPIGIGVVFACHDGAGNFLFAKRGKGARDGHGLWEIPAGELEYGETLRDGLIREVKEEFCATPREVEFIGHKEIFKKDDREEVMHHWIAFEFLVELDPSDVRIGEPDKCDAIEWHPLDKAPGPLHRGSPETIENVRKYLHLK